MKLLSTNSNPAPYFVIERAGSETAFDVMRRTGPRSSINALPNFKFRYSAERVANALNQAYKIGNRQGRQRVRVAGSGL
jgi:hypothetical protein